MCRDYVTRQQVVEMERMEGEMALHTEEVGRLRGEISSMEEDSAQLRARLKHARRRQGEAARRMTTKRQARRARLGQGGFPLKTHPKSRGPRGHKKWLA